MHPLNKKVKFMKDSIDFGSMEIPKLFRKLLIPTVLGMLFEMVIFQASKVTGFLTVVML